MSLDLRLISRFRSFEDHETQVAWFRTLVPWVAPEAYLNIIYKPAASAVLEQAAERWRFPASLFDFLRRHNGAMLLSGSLNVYGVVAPGQLLNRQDRFSLPPFDIERENKMWPLDSDRLLVVGGYRFDVSRACVDRTDEHVHVFAKGRSTPTVSWDSVDDWLTNEVKRLSLLFDNDGKRIGPESQTAPPAV